MALRIVEKIAYQSAQQPRVAPQYEGFTIEGTAIIMRAFFRQQAQQVDFLSGRRRSRDVKLACQQNLLYRAVKLGDISALIFASGFASNSSRPSLMRDSGVRNSCDALASSSRCAPTNSSIREAARLKLAAS
jgi:hypothetical protein